MRFNNIDWQICCLKDKCEFKGGGTPSTNQDRYWNGNILWISSSDIDENGIFIQKKTKYITELGLNSSATKLCPKNSILIVTRVGVGKICIADEDVCTSQDFTNIIKYDFDKYFLVYCLKFYVYKALQKSQGTSIKGIQSSEIKNLSIYYPNINTKNFDGF